jgi:hypothetical protein
VLPACCRFSLLCLAACEAALQLQLPVQTGFVLNWKLPEVFAAPRSSDAVEISGSRSERSEGRGEGGTKERGGEEGTKQREGKGGTKEAKRYDELLGQDKCSAFGEDVVFVANDWHAGAIHG